MASGIGWESTSGTVIVVAVAVEPLTEGPEDVEPAPGPEDVEPAPGPEDVEPAPGPEDATVPLEDVAPPQELRTALMAIATSAHFVA
jgi:hypothetical protein